MEVGAEETVVSTTTQTLAATLIHLFHFNEILSA